MWGDKVEDIIIRGKDGYLDCDIVTEETWLDCRGMTKELFDSLVKEGLDNGYFKWEDNYFEVRKVNKKTVNVIQDQIILPAVTKNGRKVRFVIDDVVRLEERPKRNSTTVYYEINGERMTSPEFLRRVGVSEQYIRKNTSCSSSFNINGLPVKVTREVKTTRIYELNDLETGAKLTGLRSYDMTKIIGTPVSKILENDRFNYIHTYKKYTIERIAWTEKLNY